MGRRLQAKLGVDYVYANELEVEDGRLTGRLVGDIVDGEMKARLLQDIAQRENISLQQAVAVGDGANDLPMLGVAGLGIAFRAKPVVKEGAEQAISTLGLDGILYLLGVRDRDATGRLTGPLRGPPDRSPPAMPDVTAARLAFPRGLEQPDTATVSLDSLLLACFATPEGSGPGRVLGKRPGLDLGTGCGVVGLGLLLRRPDARCRVLGLTWTRPWRSRPRPTPRSWAWAIVSRPAS